jgi:putative flippase GtrA
MTSSDRRHRARALLVRWCKFNLVGGIGIVVQIVALYFLKSLLHLNYLAATAMAVEIAVIHNFFWHQNFTWPDREGRKHGSTARFLRFNLTNGAVSILGNLVLMKLMVGEAHMHYLLANAIAIAVCSLVNFSLSDRWVFDAR